MYIPNIIREQQLIKTKIHRLSNYEEPLREFLHDNITTFLHSPERAYMLKAQDYYGNDNDIKDRKRYYIDRGGIKREAENLANAKLAHPYMRKLTKQKINYLLSKEFIVDCSDKTFTDILVKYLTPKFHKTLKNTGRDAIVNGIAWIQVYYNAQGVLSFKRIPSEEVYPFWADADHTILDAVIRVYNITKYELGGEKQVIQKVEYHTPEGVWYYEMTDKGLEPDKEQGIEGHAGHFMVKETVTDENGQTRTINTQAIWQKVPFIAFKYNDDEISLLKLIKSLIDDYDTNTSDISNIIQDIPNSIKVVRNYDGTDKEEFTRNLSVFRTVFVREDGGVENLDSPIDSTASEAHLTRLRKDIYESASGVDTQEAAVGNPSGTALKFRYYDLDLDCDDLASETRAALQELIWFICIDIVNSGGPDYTETEYDIIFNSDGITNETEVITNCRSSVGIISNDTILANHPWINNIETEQEKITKDKEAQIQDAAVMIGATDPNFGADVNE